MINITYEARERLVAMLKDQPRIGLSLVDKGCGGKKFQFSFGPHTGREVDLGAGRALVLDASCDVLPHLDIDWNDDPFAAHFVFNSPAIASRCGCGKSIKVDS